MGTPRSRRSEQIYYPIVSALREELSRLDEKSVETSSVEFKSSKISPSCEIIDGEAIFDGNLNRKRLSANQLTEGPRYRFNMEHMGSRSEERKKVDTFMVENDQGEESSPVHQDLAKRCG
jgi:hypothetical protein